MWRECELERIPFALLLQNRIDLKVKRNRIMCISVSAMQFRPDRYICLTVEPLHCNCEIVHQEVCGWKCVGCGFAFRVVRYHVVNLKVCVPVVQRETTVRLPSLAHNLTRNSIWSPISLHFASVWTTHAQESDRLMILCALCLDKSSSSADDKPQE